MACLWQKSNAMKLYKSSLVYSCILLSTVTIYIAFQWVQTTPGLLIKLPFIALLGLLICGLVLLVAHDIRDSSLSEKWKLSLEAALSVLILCSLPQVPHFFELSA